MLFKEIIGQEKVKQKLIQSVTDERISHAQLFLSDEGNGALAIAIAYAQYINCINRGANDSCGTCHSCIKYNKLIHPDLHFAYPVALSKDMRVSTHAIEQWREFVLSNPYFKLIEWFGQLNAENKQAIIGAEESAEIMRKLNLTTYESEYKVMIIWMAELMNTSAANKLLKILEEPPDKTLFILVCSNQDRLLPTIISRTQTIKLAPVSYDALVTHLIEKYAIAEKEAKQICFQASEDISKAIHLAKQDNTEVESFELFRDWMRICLRFNTQKAMEWVDIVAQTGREQQKNFLGYASQVIRACLLHNNQLDQLSPAEGEVKGFIQKFAPFIHVNNIQQFHEELGKAIFHLERNANPKILFLDLSLRMNELLNLPKPALIEG